MRSLAVIPARGGSKRVPGKNLAMVGGSTLLDRAIRAASACDQTVVSTDDLKILGDARMSGVWMHPRLPAHATDSAQLEDVIDDVLASIDRVGAETHGIGIDAIVLLQPTSPFRTAEHVAEALRILRETGCDSVVSVTQQHSLHPVFNGNIAARDKGPHTRPADRYVPREKGSRPASQSLGHLVYENGAIYAFTRRHWNATRNRMGGDMRALVMHWGEAVEIDTPEDLEAARRMARG